METAVDRELRIESIGPVRPTLVPPEVSDAARLVGLKESNPPTLAAVERRRWQLWLVAVLFVLASSALVVIASAWPNLLRAIGVQEGQLPATTFRTLLLVLTVAFAGYTLEKEGNLRKLARLLTDERVLTAALTDRLSEVSALLEAGRAMNSVLELDVVLDVILRSATALLEAAGGSIMLAEEDAEVLRSVAVHGNEFAIGAVVRFDEGIAGRVARSHEPLLINGRMAGRRREVESAMCVPLVHRGRLLGVLNVNGRPPLRYTEYHLRAVSLFAEQAASAIANARLYEIERLHVAEMVEGEVRKTEFLAGVSHDLRTPLTSLIGCTKLLQRANLSENHRVELAAMVDRQAIRLNRMIEDLLTAARLEAEGPPPLEAVDVAALADEMAAEYAAAGTPIEIVRSAEAVEVQARDDSMRRVLSNLVDNGFKHGGRNVTITICSPLHGWVEMAVRDDGPGIPESEWERMFERFWRHDANRAAPGIGLGLSIVRSLVGACGGKTWVDPSTAHGEGTTICLRLQASPVSTASPVSAAAG